MLRAKCLLNLRGVQPLPHVFLSRYNLSQSRQSRVVHVFASQCQVAEVKIFGYRVPCFLIVEKMSRPFLYFSRHLFFLA